MKTRKVLLENEAISFYNSVADAEKEESKVKIECNVGGYWKESDGLWIAFDTTSGEMFNEEFDNEQEAIKYANGIEATTKGGFSI